MAAPAVAQLSALAGARHGSNKERADETDGDIADKAVPRARRCRTRYQTNETEIIGSRALRAAARTSLQRRRTQRRDASVTHDEFDTERRGAFLVLKV